MAPIVVMPDLDIVTEVSDDDEIDMDFLMPNGIFIPMKVSFYESLELMKRRLWKEAEGYPLFKVLPRNETCSIVYINNNGQKEEVADEELTLDDLRPSVKFLKVTPRRGDDNTGTLDKQINNLIGMKAFNYIQTQTSSEVNDFRARMDVFCFNIVQNQNKDASGRLRFERSHPCRLTTDDMELPPEIEETIREGLVLTVLISTITSRDVSFKMRISADAMPSQLISITLEKLVKKTGKDNEFQDPKNFTLKVLGLEDYVYGLYPLRRFKHVHQCIMTVSSPTFLLIRMADVVTPGTIEKRSRPSTASFIASPSQQLPRSQSSRRQDKEVCLWDVTEPFTFKLISASKIEVPDKSKVKLYAGLYYGPEAFETISTDEMTVSDGQVKWNKIMKFNTEVSEIPHMCRLCLALQCKRGKETTLVSWVNVPMFDHKNRLLRGEYKFSMWPRRDQQQEDSCYPIGTVSQNPQGESATCLIINIPNFKRNLPIVFPSNEKVLQCASDNMEDPGSAGSPSWHPSKSHIQQLLQILAGEKSALTSQLAEQDKELIWMLKYECRDNYPEFLLAVLHSVSWYNYYNVAKMQALLQTWPPLPVDQMLALLDFNFPDRSIRQKATEWLGNLSDDELSQYMLQLVEALKFESHLYCPLAEFLLKRSLQNQHLGHQMFWILKSQLHDPSLTVRFGLMLEAYLTNNKEHLLILNKQQDAVLKLSGLNQIAKSSQKSSKKVVHDLRELLSHKAYAEALTKIDSPLTPLYKLDQLMYDNCKVMDSKMKPLMVQWRNADERGQNIIIMYKKGDDLRQDMLTLQMFTVMDNIWQSEGLDLRMHPYRCIATGRDEGMIEIVQNSDTISKIQKWNNSSSFDKKALFEWLKTKNSPEGLDKAVEEFTLSCAGYTVATYILGIGDRHNGNIMLKESGQLFHIDFGHFLGNFKSKFGVKRERVPFILTSHFEYVITKGDVNPENFKRFQSLCERAYLILRGKGQLLTRLFTMMIMAGIPQLMSLNDVEYLRETLALQLTDKEALEKFQQKFREAKSNSWTTSVNWWFHNRVH